MKATDSDFLNKNAYNMRWACVEEGHIPLTAADWDIQVSSAVSEAVTTYLQFQSFPYGNNTGMDAFKKAIANHFNQRKNAVVNSEEVLATNSAAKAIDDVYSFLLKEGDEILIADPVDFLLAECARRKSVIIKRYQQRSSGIDLAELDKLASSKTKALVICNPHNPLGFVLQKEQLQALSNWANEKGLVIISDEVWSDIVHMEESFTSIRAVNSKAWIVYGLSKGFGLAGLRIGAIIAPSEEQAEMLSEKQGYSRTLEGASTLSQIAATAALEKGWAHTQEAVSLFQKNLEHAFLAFNKSEYLMCEMPQGTFVLTVRHPSTWNSEMLCERLAKEGKVHVVPGLEKWFGPGAIGSFRISLATTPEITSEGVSRICSWVNTYGSTL
ncbi:MAG: pyridoxal phosphate-dependent aminotransferase [Sediminibacterium sp.]